MSGKPRFLFEASARVAKWVSVDDAARDITLPGLRAELLRRVELDQATRRTVSTAGSPVQVLAIDRDNSRWLAGVLDEHGWPAWQLVGKDGASAAWLLAQHADEDFTLQRRCLELLSQAVDAGGASPAHLAYLTDRVQLKESGDQTFGTQHEAEAGAWVPRPIREPEAVEERRRAVGLPPLDEQVQKMAKVYGPPNRSRHHLSDGTRSGAFGAALTFRGMISRTIAGGDFPGPGQDLDITCPECGTAGP